MTTFATTIKIAHSPRQPKDFAFMALPQGHDVDDASPPDDPQIIRRYLAGETEALAILSERHQAHLVRSLLGKGASPTEAEDIVANLWGDCVTNPDRPSLLEKYSGRCPFRNWLTTVATNKLTDWNRRKAFRKDVAPEEPGAAPHEYFENLASEPARDGEARLVELLRDSLQEAFARCTPEALLILRLVYLEDLTQREVAGMFQQHEAGISRALKSALKQIEKDTLLCLREKDPLLRLTWEDFQLLCETHQIGFL